MEDIRSRLGNRIRVLRKELKLSQEALALKAGLDRTYVASIECGNRNVSILNIERITDALNISLADFFDTDEFATIPNFISLNKVADKSGKKYKQIKYKIKTPNIVNISVNEAFTTLGVSYFS